MQPKKPTKEIPDTAEDVLPIPGAQDAGNASVEQQKLSGPVTSESGEATPSRNERHLSDPEQSGPAQQPPSLPTPNGQQPATPPPAQPTTQSSNVQVDNDSPQFADDVDVIEKEWVDKAKQIIDRTKNHPYRQEQEVERLQQSYLKKRYGKDVSSAD